MSVNNYDLVVIGGGIIGVATAWTLSNLRPDLRIALIESESSLGAHQSGHNSGVIHSGVYYPAGSVKANTCISGRKKLLEFCESRNIPLRICGKVIVANNEIDVRRLIQLSGLAEQHGIQAELISYERLLEIEPHVVGLKGLYLPTAAVTKFIHVLEKLADELVLKGAEIILNCTLLSCEKVKNELILKTTTGEIKAGFVVNCAGLYCDHVCKMLEGDCPIRIIPFRGEYFQLIESANHYCNALVYPTPDPALPFLGVHVTRTLDNQVKCGPNAILALARKGYAWNQVALKELAEILAYPGFIKFAAQNWQTGMYELYRSLSKSAFLRSVQRLIPTIQSNDLTEQICGVRAQAMYPDGKLASDFIFKKSEYALHVLNAPSPAATACFAIAEHIVATTGLGNRLI